MDSPDSYRISVPGSTQVSSGRQSVFAYGAVTLYGRLSHTFPLTDCFLTPMCRTLQPQPCKQNWFELFPVRSPLLGKWSLFLQVLRCFSSLGWLHAVMNSPYARVSSTQGFPIRRSPDHGLLAAPRSLSQLSTSFIASGCLGIHRTPFVA